jgi:hypothetical protein
MRACLRWSTAAPAVALGLLVAAPRGSLFGSGFIVIAIGYTLGITRDPLIFADAIKQLSSREEHSIPFLSHLGIYRA